MTLDIKPSQDSDTRLKAKNSSDEMQWDICLSDHNKNFFYPYAEQNECELNNVFSSNM